MNTFTAWAKDVALRAVKTAAQTAGAIISANTGGLTHVPLGTVVDVAGLAALICILQNLSNLQLTTQPATTSITVHPKGSVIDLVALAALGQTASTGRTAPTVTTPVPTVTTAAPFTGVNP